MNPSALILFFASCYCLQAQTVTSEERCFYYEYTAHVSTVDTDRVWKDRMILVTNTDGTSFFESYSNYLRNKTIAEMKAKGLSTQEFASVMYSLPSAKFSFSICKEYSEDRLVYTDEVVKTKYRYYEKLPSFDWKIQRKLREINGFKCQLATTEIWGRKFEAWFTEEIPIQEGPYKFYGLPGLIVEVYDDTRAHHFLLTSIENACGYTQSGTKTVYVDVTKEDFYKAVRRYYNNYIMATEEVGMRLLIPPEQKQKFDEDMRKINNLIEM